MLLVTYIKEDDNTYIEMFTEEQNIRTLGLSMMAVGFFWGTLITIDASLLFTQGYGPEEVWQAISNARFATRIGGLVVYIITGYYVAENAEVLTR